MHIKRFTRYYYADILKEDAEVGASITHGRDEKWMRGVYPKVSGLAAWSENCKWYSSLSRRAVVSLFCESV
jgi:hypothetical protein